MHQSSRHFQARRRLPDQARRRAHGGLSNAAPDGLGDSAPYFCAATETVADLANARLNWDPPLHRLDTFADMPPDPQGPAAVPAYRSPAPFLASTPEPPPRRQRRRRRRRKPLAPFDVHMDDYLGSVQGFRKRRQRLRRVLRHSLEEVSDPSKLRTPLNDRSPLPSRNSRRVMLAEPPVISFIDRRYLE